MILSSIFTYIKGRKYLHNITLNDLSPIGTTKSKSTIIINGTDTFDVSHRAGETLSVSSEDSSIATAAINGNTITITGSGVGSTNLIISDESGNRVQYPVTIKGPYGVRWDKTNSATKLTRTDAAAGFTDPVAAIGTGSGSSPFDNIYPWSMITRETVDGNEMVKIPKFYVKVENTSSYMDVKISDMKIDDSYHVSPAHKDRGDGMGERDYIYVSRYTLNSSYKSTSGNASVVSITRATARTNIHNLGANYYQYDYLTYLTILYLYIVEFADWNSQTTVGYGYANSSNSAQINTGATDSMTYHTGTAGSSRKANAAIQYRYIENFWGNIWQWVDGMYFSGSNINVIENPNNFSDTANGTQLSFTRATSGGYISDLGSDTTNPEYIYPTANNGSESTYITDHNWYSSSGVVLRSGGSWNDGSTCGVLCLTGGNDASALNSYIGTRSIYLP